MMDEYSHNFNILLARKLLEEYKNCLNSNEPCDIIEIRNSLKLVYSNGLRYFPFSETLFNDINSYEDAIKSLENLIK